MAPKEMSKETNRKHQTYAPQYRAEFVTRCKLPGNSVTSVAKELGIPASSIYLWQAQTSDTKKHPDALTF